MFFSIFPTKGAKTYLRLPAHACQSVQAFSVSYAEELPKTPSAANALAVLAPQLHELCQGWFAACGEQVGELRVYVFRNGEALVFAAEVLREGEACADPGDLQKIVGAAWEARALETGAELVRLV